jgi:hypothetical protein
MVLYFNDITFGGDVVMKAVEDDFTLLKMVSGVACTEQFLQECPLVLRSHLRSLTVAAGDPRLYPNMPDISRVVGDSTILSQFCHVHPRTTILVRFKIPRSSNSCGTSTRFITLSRGFFDQIIHTSDSIKDFA